MFNLSLQVNHRARILPLDGLRSLAIILVLLRHTFDRTFPHLETPFIHSFWGFGWVGVLIFFSLSGFLVGGTVVKQTVSQDFSLKLFLINRSLRILPAAYVFLIFAHLSQFGFNYWTFCNLTYVSNLCGGFDPDHFWSLQIEEQFYIVLPLSCILLSTYLRTSSLGLRIAVLIGTILASWIWRTADALYFRSLLLPRENPLYYLDFFLFGILAAELRPLIINTRFSNSERVGYFLTLLLGSYFFLGYSVEPFTVARPNFSVSDNASIYAWIYPVISLWCFLLIVGFSSTRNWLTRFFSRPCFTIISILSYTMYLWHIHAIQTGFTRLKLPPSLNSGLFDLTIQSIMNVALTTLVAAGLYLAIERPALILRDKILGRIP